MSGSGTYPAGVGPAGVDVNAESPAILPMTNAAQYDPRLRVLATNTDGTVSLVDPVDQEVAYCLTIALGTIASDPTRGFNWAKLRTVPHSSRANAATDLVKQALAKSISRGDVTVTSVKLHSAPGRLAIATDYINNRLADATPTTFTSTFTQ